MTEHRDVMQERPRRSGKSRRRQQPTAVEQATRLARAAVLKAMPESIDVDRELLDITDAEHVWQEVAAVEGERRWICVRCNLTEGLGAPESACPGTGGILSAALRDRQHRTARAWWAEHGLPSTDG